MTHPDTPALYDHTLERALIGAALHPPTNMLPALVAAAPTSLFHHPLHTPIWLAITARATLGHPCDPILLTTDLARTGHLTKLRNGVYLAECMETGNPAHTSHYITELAHLHQRRRLTEHATRLHQTLTDVQDPTRRTQLVNEILTAATLDNTNPTTTTSVPHHTINLKAASLFDIRPVRWGWTDRMPTGEITLIPGREGCGKSIMLAWLAAAITNGNLPGQWEGQPKAVLYAANEDSWEYTIAPRLLAAGANLDLVYRIATTTPDGNLAGLCLPRDVTQIPDAARQVDAAALMCDPILSLVDQTLNSFVASELRQALEPFKAEIEKADLIVPALVHFNKTKHADVNSMIAGARAWVEVARAAIAIAADKDADDYTVILSQTKNNLGRLDLPNLTYTIDDVTIETRHGDTHVGRLRWLGETDTSAEDLLTGDPHRQPLSDTTLTILEYVQNHPNRDVTVADIVDYFNTTIKPATIRKVLRRCVERGQLVSQTRGTYQTGNTGNLRQNGSRK